MSWGGIRKLPYVFTEYGVLQLSNVLKSEMVQYDRDYSFYHRILYGTTRVIAEHLLESDEYSDIRKVISVNLLYFDLGDGIDYVYHGTTVFKGIHNNDILALEPKYKEKLKKDTISQIFPNII